MLVLQAVVVVGVKLRDALAQRGDGLGDADGDMGVA